MVVERRVNGSRTSESDELQRLIHLIGPDEVVVVNCLVVARVWKHNRCCSAETLTDHVLKAIASDPASLWVLSCGLRHLAHCSQRDSTVRVRAQSESTVRAREHSQSEEAL